jgi:hypothetical protein
LILVITAYQVLFFHPGVAIQPPVNISWLKFPFFKDYISLGTR